MDVDKWLGSITLYEASQIWARFNSCCDASRLVLWSGIPFARAERWARQHGRQTLTQAMGPLMDKSDPRCRVHCKTANQWRRYVHAASILFTLYVSGGDEVVVLTPHPPQRLNPHRESYYQNIEEPWLKACCCAEEEETGTFQIRFAHPRVEEAQDYIYEYWPVDRVSAWTARYPNVPAAQQRWEHHCWGSQRMSAYGPEDLRRERSAVLEKLHLYRTGASVYWVATPRVVADFDNQQGFAREKKATANNTEIVRSKTTGHAVIRSRSIQQNATAVRTTSGTTQSLTSAETATLKQIQTKGKKQPQQQHEETLDEQRRRKAREKRARNASRKQIKRDAEKQQQQQHKDKKESRAERSNMIDARRVQKDRKGDAAVVEAAPRRMVTRSQTAAKRNEACQVRWLGKCINAAERKEKEEKKGQKE
ncbi:hypothetical protein PWT90_09606 [Aphanocladium album]|nr:hypothetical protein PWT90_09606 [Aphanocladium album]